MSIIDRFFVWTAAADQTNARFALRFLGSAIAAGLIVVCLILIGITGWA